MKLITFGIASIVDANTHYLHHSDIPDYDATVRHGREIRGKSVIESLNALRSFIGNVINGISDRAREKREVARLLHMNDAMLADIGLSRGDLFAVNHGISSLADLQVRREKKVKAAATGHSSQSRSASVKRDEIAANEAVFASAKCA